MSKAIKLFIADDHQMFIDGIKSLLSGIAGFEIVGEATNGSQVIEKLATCSPDIVLMDIGMSEKNGIEATELIAKKYPTIKVIALTMYDDHNRITKMLQAGAKGYILKNTSKSELIGAINAVASGETYYTKQVVDVIMKQKSEKNPDPLSLLTKREIQIIKMIVQSLTNKEIADQLSLSELTVNTHRKNAMQKLELKNTAALVKFAVDNHFNEL